MQTQVDGNGKVQGILLFLIISFFSIKVLCIFLKLFPSSPSIHFLVDCSYLFLKTRTVARQNKNRSVKFWMPRGEGQVKKVYEQQWCRTEGLTRVGNVPCRAPQWPLAPNCETTLGVNVRFMSILRRTIWLFQGGNHSFFSLKNLLKNADHLKKISSCTFSTIVWFNPAGLWLNFPTWKILASIFLFQNQTNLVVDSGCLHLQMVIYTWYVVYMVIYRLCESTGTTLCPSK